jgi:diguanylate cyclase with GGDEF domain/EAL domain-containing protein
MGPRLAHLARLLPHGRTLPAADWQRRHRALLILLRLHVGGLFGFALAQGNSAGHALFEAAAVASFALAAMLAPAGHRIAAVAVSLGLMVSSAELVHLWHGQTEAHFHFFVMISLLSLYEDWLAFGLAFGFVVAHHGAMGVMDPRSVYSHAAAWSHPWEWALIHGGFVLAAGVAGVVAWRLNEATRARMVHQSLHDPVTRLPNRPCSSTASTSRWPTPAGSADCTRCSSSTSTTSRSSTTRSATRRATRCSSPSRPGWTRVLRGNDTVARFGGDEFTVLAEDLESEAAALALADRVAAVVAAPVLLNGREVTMSASIGIALARAPEVAEDLLRDADAAMYRAKERGRARVEVFDETLRERVLRRLEVEHDLRHAVERGELRTFYQPKVRLDTGEVAGVEALVRWEHPERGLIPPRASSSPSRRRQG